MIKLIILIVIAVVQRVIASEGVLVVTPETFDVVISKELTVVVLFSEEGCKYCDQFSEIYSMIANLHAQKCKFTKILLSKATQQLFEEYQILSVPTVLTFYDTKLIQNRFQPFGTGNTVSVHFFKWIERLYSPLKNWQGEEDHSHQIVVHCNNEQIKQMWGSIAREELWLDLYCGTEQFMGQHLTVVSQYGKRVQAWQLQSNNTEEIKTKVKRLIKSYKYKYVLNWNTAIIQEIFVRNISAFVLIINNETQSAEIYAQYEQIKKKWYQHSINYQPTIFAVADLSLTPYQTIKLKRYLSGTKTLSIAGNYYYPLVGFIQRGKKQGKYIYDWDENQNNTGILSITRQKLNYFVEDVDKHLIKGIEYTASQTHLKIYLNEYHDDKFLPNGQHTEQQVKSHNETTTIINKQKNWQYLLSKSQYPSPFLVYVTWRHDYKLQVLEKEFRDWWVKEDAQFEQHRQQFNVFIHVLNVIDLPNHPALLVDYVPSLFYIDREKTVKKLEGVTSLEKIKIFINEQYSQSIKDRQHQSIK